LFKWLGLICIVAASSGVGFGYARSIRRQSAQLGHLIDSLGYMRSEILYRMTPLPELFETLSGAENNAVGLFFSLCASQLRSDRTMPIPGIFKKSWENCRTVCLSPETKQTLLSLGMALGRFDVDGQCRAIELAEQKLRREQETLDKNKRARCRGYEAIGICAGLAAAIVIL
jgi:stage III sporulation protein AB